MDLEKTQKRKHEEQDKLHTTDNNRSNIVAEAVNVCCPICQVSLSYIDLECAERHVNGCLDIEFLEKKKKTRRINNNSTTISLSPKAENSIISIKQEIVAEETINAKPTSTKTKEPYVDQGTLVGSVEKMLQEIENTTLPSTLSYPSSQREHRQKYVYKNAKTASEIVQRNTKPLPNYKRMPHTSFTVDAFKYGKLDFCTGYFLTHFHSDHYGGLTKRFSGDIYCTRITANCIINKLGVNPECVHAIPMNTRCLIQNVYVTFIDANHCPGSAIILFEIPVLENIIRIVHTGDFRASDRHVSQILDVFETNIQQPISLNLNPGYDNGHSNWKRAVPMIDYLYLDTTYLQPTHTFPTQDSVIQTVVEFCCNINDNPAYLTNFLQRISRVPKKSANKVSQSIKSEGRVQSKPALLTKWFQPKPSQHNLPTTTASPSRPLSGSFKRRRVLFVVGSYSIGKERLFIEIARQLGTKIYVSRDKRSMLECIGSPSLLALLANSMPEAQVHVVSMNMINMQGMAEYLQAVQKEAVFFSSIVAFSPTGWSHGGAYYSHEQQPLVWPEKVAYAYPSPKPDDSDIEHMVAHIACSARIQTDSSTNTAFCIDSLRPRGSSNKITIFPVSYSEHSSFTELAQFVCSLKIGTVVPTVFSSEEKNKLAKSWLQHWQDLKAEFGRILRNSVIPKISSGEHIVPCFHSSINKI